jgi:L-lactate dehydrogenase
LNPQGLPSLAGHVRADPVEGWAANVLVQVLDPACFGGEEDFRRQTQWLAEACRAAPPRAGFDRVRLPGEGALARRAVHLERGVELHPSAVAALRPWSEKLHIAFPRPRQ